jgi:large subunit ribosomal protein L25
MELQAETREAFGRDIAALRVSGRIPAELYGHGVENLHLNVSLKDFHKVFKEAGENTVVEIVINGKKHPTLIYDVQMDPVSDEVVHADFYVVRMDEKIKAKIPVEFEGEAPAVKEKSGILVKALQEIEVEALPGDLPHNIKVDVSILIDIDMSIHIKDLPAVKGVEILMDPETVIATMTAQMTEEEEAALAGPTDVTEVKVETEEEKAAREAEKLATGEAPKETPKETPKDQKKDTKAK